MKITTPLIRTSTGRPFLRPGFILIRLTLACSTVLPSVQAVSPPPDGGYAVGNTAEGQNALLSLTTGTFNTAVGLFSLRALTAGNFNTANGAGALLVNTANGNTATGAGALLGNTTGESNTATGAFTLFSNNEGFSNTAIGDRALFHNTTGSLNTASGVFALFSNTEGGNNTAIGQAALFNNTEGNNNMAIGVSALFSNTTGNDNTANGADTLEVNTTGSSNTASGTEALITNTTGDFNTAIGANALLNNKNGSKNIALGFSAGDNLTTGDNNIDIGAEAVADESDTIRIGGLQRQTIIAGIRGVTTANADAIPVLIDSAGQLGTISSSRRFKREIKSMDQVSEAILALKPVTFYYKSDTTDTRQFGLIAEEVAELRPDLVVRDKNGEIYTVRYDAVNAMLLNEFLKEHRKVEKQQATISELKSTLAQQRKDFELTATQQHNEIQALTASFKEQASQIQKVSAQLATASPSRGGLRTSTFAARRIRASGPAPQLVNNP